MACENQHNVITDICLIFIVLALEFRESATGWCHRWSGELRTRVHTLMEPREWPSRRLANRAVILRSSTLCGQT